MNRDLKKYLFDVQVSINSINEYLGKKRNFLEYQNNKLLRRGIERELEIIGEAMNRALKLDPSKADTVPSLILLTLSWNQRT